MIVNYLHSRLAMGITALVMLLLMGIVWMGPIGDELAIARNQSEKIDDESLVLQRMGKQASGVKRAANSYRQNLEEMVFFQENYLRQKDERILAISRFLAQRAKSHRVKMELVDYQATNVRDKGIQSYRIDFPLEGRYRDIRKFIADIEKSDMFWMITAMSLEEMNPDQGTVTVDLSITTYFEGA